MISCCCILYLVDLETERALWVLCNEIHHNSSFDWFEFQKKEITLQINFVLVCCHLSHQYWSITTNKKFWCCLNFGTQLINGKLCLEMCFIMRLRWVLFLTTLLHQPLEIVINLPLLQLRKELHVWSRGMRQACAYFAYFYCLCSNRNVITLPKVKGFDIHILLLLLNK